ncbi:hypothetical protein PALB_50 [Pseudoalteromonas luteoviolacea B = ATCC 29581]|nr:hypothetical protein PALB_50 [Pseudoalteromonas luteoviolacea B = ATCC 29581]
MHHPKLKFFPPILVAFADDSGNYPTALSVLANGTVYHWYVKPEKEWLTHHYSLSKSEGLSISYLNQVGQSCSYIFDQLIDVTFGYSLLHTIGLHQTTKLMLQFDCETLPNKNSPNMVFAIKDVAELAPKRYRDNFTKEMALNPDCFQLNPNSTSDVCVAAALTVLRLNSIRVYT